MVLDKCAPGSICHAPNDNPLPVDSALRRMLAFFIIDTIVLAFQLLQGSISLFLLRKTALYRKSKVTAPRRSIWRMDAGSMPRLLSGLETSLDRYCTEQATWVGKWWDFRYIWSRELQAVKFSILEDLILWHMRIPQAQSETDPGAA
jgi:hypothetical protein